MKPVFPDEVVRELGYQKYWPEKSDWFIAIVGVLFVTFLLGGIAFFFLAPREEVKMQKRNALISQWCEKTTVRTLQEEQTCASIKK